MKLSRQVLIGKNRSLVICKVGGENFLSNGHWAIHCARSVSGQLRAFSTAFLAKQVFLAEKVSTNMEETYPIIRNALSGNMSGYHLLDAPGEPWTSTREPNPIVTIQASASPQKNFTRHMRLIYWEMAQRIGGKLYATDDMTQPYVLVKDGHVRGIFMGYWPTEERSST